MALLSYTGVLLQGLHLSVTGGQPPPQEWSTHIQQNSWQPASWPLGLAGWDASEACSKGLQLWLRQRGLGHSSSRCRDEHGVHSMYHRLQHTWYTQEQHSIVTRQDTNLGTHRWQLHHATWQLLRFVYAGCDVHTAGQRMHVIIDAGRCLLAGSAT
jgi:hypothetical protein